MLLFRLLILFQCLSETNCTYRPWEPYFVEKQFEEVCFRQFFPFSEKFVAFRDDLVCRSISYRFDACNAGGTFEYKNNGEKGNEGIQRRSSMMQFAGLRYYL